MRAWIARDADGSVLLYFDSPEWEKGGDGGGGYWCGDIFVVPKGSTAEIVDAIGLLPGHKQQIELTARPVGAAEGGDDGQ